MLQMDHARRAGQHLVVVGGDQAGYAHRVEGAQRVQLAVGSSARMICGRLTMARAIDTCTRDVYPAGKRFSLRGALGIAHDVASAARHLHARGITHGDLYGHNVLHCGEGSALLGDFGAASFHDPGSPHATALERIEVRAFGCLLEELLERCDGDVPPQLALLRDDCLLPAPASRPLFQMVEQRLRSLLDNH
eukprot:gene23710-26830_t